MRYSLTVLERDWEALTRSIFGYAGLEGAAYLLCGESVTAGETRLLVRDVIPVRDEHYHIRRRDLLSIVSDSYVPIAKRASERKESIVFVHSHPESIATFSSQDNDEDPKLLKFFAKQAPGGHHGTMVISRADDPPVWDGRMWRRDSWVSLRQLRIIGRRFRFSHSHSAGHHEEIPVFFDRQVKAFGPEIQHLLQNLHIGVVGAGGTGSAVIEQLTRLGLGTLSVFEFDDFEGSNVNRVYGSSVKDDGMPKIAIARRNIEHIGLGTKVRVFPKGICGELAAKELRDCDIVFGCTDKHGPRGILVQLALRYIIPLFDVGVKIESNQGIIQGVYSRVTTFFPGEACLFCRGRISPETIALETLSSAEQAALVKEGYADELDTESPAVIMFTTAAATQAICELLHRLTGFMGSDRQSTEVLLRVHSTQLGRNREQSKAECVCSERKLWGRGDTRRFLDLSWPGQK